MNFKEQFILFDGAMGTQLQARGLPVGENPEYFNLSHPEIVRSIHKDYVDAGVNVITTNTFQANRTKVKQEDLPSLISSAIAHAKDAGASLVAYDMGPIGQLLRPAGTLSFDEAYNIFKEQVLLAEQNGANLVLIETMSDLLEVKAAILAVKENTKLPIFATMSYQADARTFMGCDPLTATLTLQSLNVDAIGVNCSLGPVELSPIVDTILEYAKVPVMVQANAGLPEIINGETYYSITVEEYVQAVGHMVQKGVQIVGGCCGTTPEFTKGLRAFLDTQKVVKTSPRDVSAVTSGLKTVIINEDLTLIGERINPTGKRRLKEALRNKDLSYILQEGLAQAENGADILDVNVGLPEIDEAQMMVRVLEELQAILANPLQIDSSSVQAIEEGARHYNGCPLINSVNGKQESLDTILPIVKKYGGVVLGLCLDEEGIPKTARGRLEIAQKILLEAKKYEIEKSSVLIDPLVLTASAQQDQVNVTLETLRLLKDELGVRTVVGLSNVSFGLPNRELLNATFLAQAVGAGLNVPILNPLNRSIMETVRALKVLLAQDRDSVKYIEQEALSEKAITDAEQEVFSNRKTIQKANAEDGVLDLKEIVIKGRKELAANQVEKLLILKTPLDIVDEFLIPALNEVGGKFERGELFLPQLMQTAQTVKNAQEVLKKHLESSNEENSTNRGKIILATVAGDIHDIGKNIVKMILENYGFQIFDLGKDVSSEQLVEAIQEHDTPLVGLSALMTTTVKNMKKSIEDVREAGLNVKFFVGGAVLNEEYREFVGAEYYARDALESVKIAQNFFAENL
ncbi:MAG: homocysteine S-methyltransferase family protein [Lactobacillales bacterium]|nr:homocysteine S-methyltransferase family protein [Lactobacillales bacterium]